MFVIPSILNYRNLSQLLSKIFDVEVQTSDAVQKVEFYLDGELCHTDVERPFTWRLNIRAFLKKTTIQVYGYTYAHGSLMSIYDVDEKEVTLLNCFPQLHILP